MKRKGLDTAESAEFRPQTEAELRERPVRRETSLTDVESQRLIHELEVHQVELEMQNHALLEIRHELEQSLGRYADLYDFAPVGYATLEGDDAIREINLAGAALLGTERAHLIGRRFGLFISTETRPVFNKFLAEALRGVTHASCEVIIAPNGAPSRYVQLEGIGASYHADRQCRIALLDITKRKRAEQALLDSEEKYRMVADFTYDWEYWRDPDGKYLYVSPSCERITGYPPEMFMADPGFLMTILHPEDQQQMAWHCTHDQETPAMRLDFRIITRTGQECWVGHVCQPVYGTDGRFLGRRGSNRDITHRKQLEADLRHSLHEKELLLREVHHRVKNNFASIISLVELQQQDVIDPSASVPWAELTHRLRSMSMVHEMLYESQSLAQIDFHRYLESLTQYLQDCFCPSGMIRIQVRSPNVWMSLDHAIPCGLIVNELVTNAFKHAFPGGQPHPGADHCEVQVSAAWDGAAYILTIADNGVGLPEELDWLNAPSLGLRLVRMLGRHQLQGRIELDRSKGARFTLRFQPPAIVTQP
jgi:PAS domain S-box-containing protein